MNSRPFAKASTKDLKFGVGVGEAGLKIWNKRTAAYKECALRITQMKDELALREQEGKDS